MKMNKQLWIAIVSAGLVGGVGAAGVLDRAVEPARTSAAGPSVSARPVATSVVRIGCTVSDLDAAVRFYTGVLGFQKVSEHDGVGEAAERLSGVFASRTRSARLRLGDEELELTEFVSQQGRPIPPDSRGNDQWFQHIAIVVSDMDQAAALLRSHGVRLISSGPQTLPKSIPNAAGISALYFKDPDGHALELIYFPPDKGDPRWRERSGGPVFLGIDHTAIACTDTEKAIAFYSGTMGLRVAGGSENFGTEQEHLNGVFNARVRVTTLRAEHGPGIELLEYLAPGPGRPTPIDSKANDLWHWQVTLATPDADAAYAAFLRTKAGLSTPGVIDATPLGRALAVRDPDRHALILAEQR